jgi:hypothetical protein
LEENLKSLKVLFSLFVVFMTFSVFAGTASVFPLAAKEDDRLAAEDIDVSIEEVIDDVKGADAALFADSLGTKAKKELAKCGEELGCQKKFISKSKKKYDFYIFSKMKFVKKSGKTIIETYLVDSEGGNLGKEKVNFDKGASTEKIASKLVKVWSKMLASNSVAKDEPEEEEEEPVKPAKKSYGKGADSAIKDALEAYASGDLKAADKLSTALPI